MDRAISCINVTELRGLQSGRGFIFHAEDAFADIRPELDAIRPLPASLPINISAFLLGYQAYRGFLFWAVFALFNGILSCCGGGLARSILALTGLRVRTYS